MLGATKPATVKVPVVLDPFAAMSFLGVLAGALSADAVQKGRSLFANFVGERVGTELFTLVDDGTNVDGAGASPFDDEGVRAANGAVHGGVLQGFLYNAYTGHKGGTTSTGNGKRGYRSVHGVGTSNFYLTRAPRRATSCSGWRTVAC